MASEDIGGDKAKIGLIRPKACIWALARKNLNNPLTVARMKNFLRGKVLHEKCLFVCFYFNVISNGTSYLY